jgi:hypothetical protein
MRCTSTGSSWCSPSSVHLARISASKTLSKTRPSLNGCLATRQARENGLQMFLVAMVVNDGTVYFPDEVYKKIGIKPFTTPLKVTPAQ